MKLIYGFAWYVVDLVRTRTNRTKSKVRTGVDETKLGNIKQIFEQSPGG